jgi:hypothetical protein
VFYTITYLKGNLEIEIQNSCIKLIIDMIGEGGERPTEKQYTMDDGGHACMSLQ